MEAIVRRLRAVLALVFAVLRIRGGKLRDETVPDESGKDRVLRAIEFARNSLDLRRALRIVGLSSSRYHSWRNASVLCELSDEPTCPRSKPTRLTFEERTAMRDMVESREHRHWSIASIALQAQRLAKVFASISTWYTMVRRYGWKRARRRVYPPKPKIGLRADSPNQYWHLDTTIIRLLDGTKVFVQAIIDNFTRRIVAWRISRTLDSPQTAKIIKRALRLIGETAKGLVRIVCDSGVENLNEAVDALIEEHNSKIKRLVAQIDLAQSNSMIEAFWKRLRHSWLYQHTLDSFEAVRRLVKDFVHEHNFVVPQVVLKGLTPDEAFRGKGQGTLKRMEVGRRKARARRIEENRSATCPICPSRGDPPQVEGHQ